ncbi:MAG TPA: DUF4215 domain-containing protein [Candidatus Acidoferrales bacterium]|nr:DUF4215 domain-containing protein [Candidatus Acidoferrales bacterium]
MINGSEQCDDGNAVNGDGCDNNCKTTGYGNGIVTAGEQCDDGNNVNTDGCSNTCLLPVCGDGIVNGTDVCDDGNQVDGDGCTRQCKAFTTDIGKCQLAVANAVKKYFAGRSGALQSCRNALNKSKPRYFDKAKTMALTDPSQCVNEYATATKLANLLKSARNSIAKKCTDLTLAALSSCSQQLDGIVNPAATTGCLPILETTIIDSLIDDEYGRALTSTDTAENVCQLAIANAGRAFVKKRVNALRACRDKLNKLKPLFLDKAKTMPITDPAQCPTEYNTATKLANAAKALRTAVSNPKKCSDTLIGSLTSTCANTIDGLVDASATTGCLLTEGISAADSVIDVAY